MSASKIAMIGGLALLLLAGLLAMVRQERVPAGAASISEPQYMKDLNKPGMGELKKQSSAENAEVTDQSGTETAFRDADGEGSMRERAILAGGCFWGMEEILRRIPGVLRTSVGYSGGSTTYPTYEEVCTGRTGHAEAIEVEFDPTRLKYEELLNYFFRMHDPTTLNRQHNDVGTQYRSAIFYTSDGQKEIAEQVKARWNSSGKFKRPIVTEITAAGTFYPAEDYHQKYLVKNPGGYNCHVLRD